MFDEGLSPICFGAVSFYSQDSDRCLACASFQACGPKVHANMQKISQVLDIEGLLAQHRAAKNVAPKGAAKPAQDQGNMITQAPVERAIDPAATAKKRAMAASVLAPLIGTGTTQALRAELAAGKNPFEPAMKEQWVLCELLRRGATTRAVIEQAVERITPNKARTKVYVSVLLAAKIVTAGEGDKLLLNPAS